MPCYECRHIRANGHKCRALAMQETPFCWFHHNARKRAKTQIGEALVLPPLEDVASIQLALGDVLTRLAKGTLDPRSAGALLYGLQIASNNLRHIKLPINPFDLVIASELDPENGEIAHEQASDTYFLEGELEERAARSRKKPPAAATASLSS